MGPFPTMLSTSPQRLRESECLRIPWLSLAITWAMTATLQTPVWDTWRRAIAPSCESFRHVHHDHYVICSLLINSRFLFLGKACAQATIKGNSTACSTGHAQYATVIAKLLTLEIRPWTICVYTVLYCTLYSNLKAFSALFLIIYMRWAPVPTCKKHAKKSLRH